MHKMHYALLPIILETKSGDQYGVLREALIGCINLMWAHAPSSLWLTSPAAFCYLFPKDVNTVAYKALEKLLGKQVVLI